MQATYTKKKTRCLAMASVFSLLLSAGLAQVATPSTPATTSVKPQGEVIELSPFVVDGSEDQGYRATSTLAGSRIKTDLKDIAQSITVVTKEFLDDVGAVNADNIFAYTTNTEGTRDYTQTSAGSGGYNDSVAANPNSSNRVRGLQAPDVTRDYFFSLSRDIGFDTYNLDQVTIVRGPNSILAGLGSPAGIVNYSPQTAWLGKNHTEVSYRLGSYSDQRATFNTNYVIKPDMLAIRLAAAWSNYGFQQRPSYSKDQRLYGAITFQPWKKTTFRASYEKVKVNSNNPNTLTPKDGVSAWIAGGQPTFDRNTTPLTPVTAPLTAAPTEATYIFSKGGAIERAISPAGDRYFYQPFPAGVAFYTEQTLNDSQYLNLEKTNLNPSTTRRSLNAFALSIDQELAKGLYANVSYLKEKTTNDQLNLFRPEYFYYRADVNARLPNGNANPHFRETFLEYRGLDNVFRGYGWNESKRATLTYDLNLTKTNKWLGRYRLTGFGERRRTESDNFQYNARQVGAPDETIRYRYYLGGNPGNNFVATDLPHLPGLLTGIPGVTNVPSGTLDSYYGLKSNNGSLRKLDTYAGVVQGYFWGDRILAMYGIRNDKDNNQTVSGSGISGLVNGGIKPHFPGSAADVGFSPKFKKDTKTLGLVARPLKWLSFHYNKSDNFVPNASTVTLLNEPTPSPTGTTKDYGIAFSFFDDKLNISLNHYVNTAAGAPAPDGNLARWTVPYMDANFMPNLVAQYNAANPGTPIAYKQAISNEILKGTGPSGVGDPRLDGSYTQDQISKGLELEFTYNITKNWRMFGNVAKAEVKQTNIALPLTALIEERLAYWSSLPVWNNPAYVYNNTNNWGVGRTGLQQWQGDNEGSYLAYKAADGRPSTQLAKWHATLVTNYSFDRGILKGFSVGFSGRYIEKNVIGLPAIRNSSGTVIGLDLDHAYYANARIAMDAWVGYRTKVYGDKYDLRVQLNIRDLDQNGGFRPVVANSDGSISIYRIVQPRTFYLNTTLEF